MYSGVMAYRYFKRRKVELAAILALFYWPCWIWTFFLLPWLNRGGVYSRFDDLFMPMHPILLMLYVVIMDFCVPVLAWTAPFGMLYGMLMYLISWLCSLISRKVRQCVKRVNKNEKRV
jgi:hypothetical protein